MNIKMAGFSEKTNGLTKAKRRLDPFVFVGLTKAKRRLDPFAKATQNSYLFSHSLFAKLIDIARD